MARSALMCSPRAGTRPSVYDLLKTTSKWVASISCFSRNVSLLYMLLTLCSVVQMEKIRYWIFCVDIRVCSWVLHPYMVYLIRVKPSQSHNNPHYILLSRSNPSLIHTTLHCKNKSSGSRELPTVVFIYFFLFTVVLVYEGHWPLSYLLSLKDISQKPVSL